MSKLPSAKGESPGVARVMGQLKEEARTEGKPIEQFARSPGSPSTNSGVMKQSWCCNCRAIQPMTVNSTQTLKARNERIPPNEMSNARHHKEEPKGGYWCAVCKNRPHTAPREPGRQEMFWEKEV